MYIYKYVCVCQDLPAGGFWTPLNRYEAIYRHLFFLVLVCVRVPTLTP